MSRNMIFFLGISQYKKYSRKFQIKEKNHNILSNNIIQYATSY
jgi:hypothetical protein